MFEGLPLRFGDGFFGHHFEKRYRLLRSFVDKPEIFKSREFEVRGFRYFVVCSFHGFLLIEFRIRPFKLYCELSRSLGHQSRFDFRSSSQLPSVDRMYDIFHFKFYKFVSYLIRPHSRIRGSVLFKLSDSFVSHSKISRLMFRSHQNIYPCSFSHQIRIPVVRTFTFLDHRKKQCGYLVMRFRRLLSFKQRLEIHIIDCGKMLVFIEFRPFFDFFPDPVISFQEMLSAHGFETAADPGKRTEQFTYTAIKFAIVSKQISKVFGSFFIVFFDAIL